jgi:hypothetical protein
VSPAPRLPDVVGRLRRYLARRAWLAALPWAGAALLAVLLLAWLLVGPGEWPQGTPAPLLLDVALLVGLGLGAWAVRKGLERRLSDPGLTGSMEEAAGLPAGSILGPLELSRRVPPGVSESLAERAEHRVLRAVDLPDERLAGRLGSSTRTWRTRGWMALGATGVLAAVAAGVAPERAASAWRGLGAPVSLLARPVLPPLRVTPGDAEVPRGQDVEVVASAPLRDSVTLHWQASGDVPRSEVAELVGGRARFTVRDVRAPVRYRVSAPDGAATVEHLLTPVDPLLVGDLTVELTFPAYTGRPPEAYRGDVPPLTVPAGTRLSILGRANRALREAALVDSLGSTVVDLGVDGRSFQGRWWPTAGGTFDWRFRDAGGEPPGVTPVPLELAVVADSAPEVRFTFPARDTVLPLDLRQPLVLQARDDYGIRDLELVAWRVTSLGDAEPPRVQRMDLGGTRAVLARPLLDLSGWGLLPGDTVRYYGRVRDNAGTPGEATTREYVLRMPGASEMRRGAERGLEAAADRLEELGERAARAEAENRDLERRAAAREGARRGESPAERTRQGEQRVGFEEREELRQAAEEQAEMGAEVDSLRQAMRDMADAMREAGVADPGLQEDLDELQDLLEEITSSEERERLERMVEALQEMDPREAREALESLVRDQESFRERLEESVERFKRAAVEQDFRATAAEAEELARQEEALAEAFREEDDPRGRAEQQDALSEQAAAAEERMERLEQRLTELGETDAAREVRQARERSGESRQAMERAAREARQRDGQRAGDEAERAAGAMQEAAGELQQAQQQMAQEQAAAMERALRRTAEDALSLARRQSELRDRMASAGREEMVEMRGDEAALEQGLRNMADNLSREGDGQAAGRELSEQLGRAMQAIRGTVQSMEGRGAASPSPEGQADEAVATLNDVALTAMAAARAMSRSGQGQGQTAQGGGDVQERLERLAQQQGGLNRQSGQMMPLQLGEQALGSQLQQIARGQQSVADELGSLADEPAGESQSLGDLEALAEEARSLAQELAGGRLEPETRRRQEELFHRLLDAGRSLENEETSDERESSAAGAFRRGEVLPLGPEELRALRYRLPDAAAMQRLSPAERRLVIDYFERLNRASEGGGGGR